MPLPHMVKKPVERYHRQPLIAGALLEQVAAQLRQQFGLDYPGPRRQDLARLLSLAALEIAPESPAHWLQQLAAPWPVSIQHQLIGFLTVGETYFFREPDFFQQLAEQLQAAMARAQHRGEQRLRIWSAGCCSGEEIYSVLITLDRLLLRQWSSWQVLLLGTDLNPAFLQRARQGEYGSYALRHVDAPTRTHYFEPQDRHWRLAAAWRERVQFIEQNLAQADYPDPTRNVADFDLILCRNVLMYFAPELAGEAITRLHRCLNSEGVLVLSAVEASLATAVGLRGIWQAGAYLIPALQAPLAVDREPPPSIVTAFKTARPSARPAAREIPRPHVSASAESPSDPLSSSSLSKPSLSKPSLSQPSVSKPALTQPLVSAPATTGFAPLWQQAQQAIQAGESTHAIALLQQSLTLPALTHAQQFEVCLALARAQANLHVLAEAGESLELCRQLQPLDPRPYWLRSLLHAQRDATAEAVTAVRKVIYLAPDFIMAHLLYGQLLLRLGEREQSQRALHTCLALLMEWPDDQPVPESDGHSASHLRSLCNSLMKEIGHGRRH